MVTIVNLSTAVDMAYVVSGINIGGVNRVAEKSITPGGKGLNVAKAARILGEEVVVTGFNGGKTGQYIEEEMMKRGITCDFVGVPGASRYSVHVMDRKSGKSTSFLENGFSVTDEDIEKFFQKFTVLCEKSEIVVISGRVPEGCGDDIYADIIKLAAKKGKRALLDASGQLLQKGVGARPFMVKPNGEEIRQLLSRPVSGKWQLIEGATNVFDMGIPLVAVSTGAGGAVVVSWDGVLSCKPPVVNAVNDVGCGDSMMAGFAVGLSRGCSLEETFAMAVAAATANAMTMEPGVFREEDYMELKKKVNITRIM